MDNGNLESFKRELFNTLEECSALFFEHYIYPYNIVISLKGEKPIEPLLEIEKAVAHLMQSLKDVKDVKLQERAFRNLKRFEGHIERMLLDLYKLAFLTIIEELEKVISSTLCIDSERESCKKVKILLEIKDFFKKARDYEMNNLGASAQDGKREILNNYKEMLKLAYRKFREVYSD